MSSAINILVDLLAQEIEAVLADPTIPLALQERVATLRTAS